MDVRLSAEQHALRDSVAHVAGGLGPRAVGELDDRERAEKLGAAIAASGWRELRTPEAGARPWASAVETALVAEELAAGLADAPFLGPTLAADLRRLAGAPLAATDETVAFAADLSGAAVVPDGGSPAGALAVDAEGAGTALVLVAAPDGYRLGTVPVRPASTQVDLTRSVAVIEPGTAPALVEGQTRTLTADDLARSTALGLALTSADLVGVMRGAVELSVGYAADRRQFGAAIGSFQAVQHLLADAFVAVEGSRSLVLHAAWAVDVLDPDGAVAAGAQAKAYAARAARTVCETAIQVHGGIGNTWDCLAHVYLRRALLSIDAFGGVGPNLDRVLAHHGIGVA